MASLIDWLTKERCLWHAEPIFDRDRSGRAMFRCPRCMATWPILAKQATRERTPTTLVPFESAVVRARR